MARVKRRYQIDDNTVIYQTDCLYTQDGQVVVVRFLDGGKAQFEDISRMVYGICTNAHTSEDVERAYLNGDYDCDIDYQLSRELRQLGREYKCHVPCSRV